MCGRFSQSERVDRIATLFDAEPDAGLPEGSHNVAPTDAIRFIAEPDGVRRLMAARWGYRPFWLSRDGSRDPGWINARAETAAESPAFGPALRQRRCIIPADAFYEWDRGPRPPQPYAIGPARAGEMLALAGLWATAERGEVTTAAILTTGPNAAMAGLHDRMPVVLGREDLATWLAPEATLGEVMSLLVPAPDDAVRIWPVSTAVNRVGTNGAELLAPIDIVPATLGLG